MTSKVDIIKSSKLILRDYTGIFNELIYLIENDEELFNIHILNRMKKNMYWVHTIVIIHTMYIFKKMHTHKFGTLWTIIILLMKNIELIVNNSIQLITFINDIITLMYELIFTKANLY